ncbi:heparinase II/III domain-containing protein [Paludibaculum fermentans]|uniref:Heparinase II/III family protein n=1 Tax=Paludibaculum fermentans TaxID=1473598 RepID=A0A7S7NNM5_PALFE|nr:heparinase II/III family protein [Paludibaculum fermentans]QOY86942.1 heparinase II/III family protein [Paludibaculum fermentans]
MFTPTRRAVLAAPAAALLANAQDVKTPPESRRLLSSKYEAGPFANLLLPRTQWNPYPRATDRPAWQALPQDLRSAFVAAANQQKGKPWPSLPATVFLDFQRNGNRTRFEDLSFGRRNRLRQAVLAECMEGEGRFLDDILDGLWLVCEESFWGVPAHIGAQKAGNGLPDISEPIVDLFAAETANTVAWTDYLLGAQLEKLSPLIRPRLLAEVRRRMLEPCATRNDFGWMGLDPQHQSPLNNWTPWIDSNWLAANLLMERDEARRSATAYRILNSIDRFLDYYHPDGGCDEGPSYWSRAGASLFECLELLHSASSGRLDYFGTPLVHEIGTYIYKAHIAADWYVNFADASARVVPNGNLVWRYGQRIKDPGMIAHGAWIAATHPKPHVEPEALGRAIDEVFHTADLRAASAAAQPPLVRDVFLPGVQVFTARRRQGSTEGFYVAAQGGHNAESHNHNDVGNFIVFHDGEPVLVDVGVEMYTAKTFSSRRYEIWTMQSGWHNCPTINGVSQQAGRRFEAATVTSSSDDRSALFSLELQHAYLAEAGVKQWRRQVRLDRTANSVSIQDQFQLTKTESVELSLITIRAPKEVAPGELHLEGGFVLRYDKSLRAVIDEHASTDARLQPIWGPLVRRIRLSSTTPPAEGGYTVAITRT